MPLLNEFRERYPDVHLDLLLSDDNLDLFAENIDLACRLTPSFQSNLVGFKLFDTRYHLCASPQYLANSPEICSSEDITEHNCVVFALPHFRSRWRYLDEQGLQHEVKVNSDIAVSSALAVRECALMGMGPALLADWMIGEELATGKLVDIFPQYRWTATDFDTAAWLLYPSRKYLPSKTRVMVDFLREKLSP